MSEAESMVLVAREPTDEYGGHEPPPFELEAYTPAEIEERIRGGEADADLCEELLTRASRERGGFDLAIGEGLDALRKSDGLAELCFHLGDYAREVLGMSARNAQLYARLARELRSRPLLRDAVRSGRVRFRAAYEVLPVARGEAEAAWVERASKETVRALQKSVRAARVSGAEPPEDEAWLGFRAGMKASDLGVVDEALAVAGKLMPGSTRAERLEAIAQEFLGAAASVAEEPEDVRLNASFRPPRDEERPDDDARKEALENEAERWSHLPQVPGVPAPCIDFEELGTADAIDGKLRELARKGDGWDRYVGFAVRALHKGRIFGTLGFTSFRHYAEERLGLSPRSVEQRAQLEEELCAKPALREAEKEGLSYEKLRLLSRLPDHEVKAWTERARTMTCIALRRALEADRERQLCAQRKFAASVPRSTALLLVAAFGAVRKLTGMQLPDGKCLGLLAAHFLAVWRPHVKGARTPSQKARERDVYCQVPGCSHLAAHAHHEVYRSHGGSDDLLNLIGLCGLHHQRCIHEGHLAVVKDPLGQLEWWRRGSPFTAGVEARASSGVAAV